MSDTVSAVPTAGIPMDNEKARIILQKIFDGNHFTNHVGVVIDSVAYGKAHLHMLLDADVHANISGHIHGGAFYTMINTGAGVAAMSTGRYVVTQNAAINFFRNSRPGHTVTCDCEIVHLGRRTITLDAKVFDDENRLLCEAAVTMFVVGYSDEIPIEW